MGTPPWETSPSSLAESPAFWLWGRNSQPGPAPQAGWGWDSWHCQPLVSSFSAVLQWFSFLYLMYCLTLLSWPSPSSLHCFHCCVLTQPLLSETLSFLIFVSILSRIHHNLSAPVLALLNWEPCYSPWWSCLLLCWPALPSLALWCLYFPFLPICSLNSCS